ncbi:GntR family transcriptional regulator [Micromonospora sp. WMMD710]|uniref:GntR family transcriptional regulator n=1 Tax=Micromonospora sp. WMMD710 TaxID=3016085 RepID=UPI0024169DEB|nr:GntR family transcriptional regulator [Micromonospora sp. WMMD710]MDG4762367.1 GntR family transcriptional regulator [Micromonospora sp. WMMD710]MDG4762389.1 GntR family transcriptional regulator [Micromonospora sp. WMMD710]MDG4762413.1 GntR family transcriptional regulator [Micromonospora sp. WMMD710]MDG4762459.1 GntR family transcriptional regulator [Micromonospora sp. WMMD710]MDG4762494.1 GntR family transcriptional regulator [Micromonospora sp. WMMD710]
MPMGYREIAAALRSAIEAGTHQPGDRLPTEQALAAEYDVSRETVRRALAALKTAGLVTTATSQGTIVARPPVRVTLTHYAGAVDPSRPGRELGPWETACAEQGVPSRVEVTGVGREPAPADVARRLELPPDAEVVHRRRLMHAGDDLAQLQDSWIPVDVAAGTALEHSAKVVGGLYAALTAAGIELATATEEVAGRGPTTDEQEQLDLPDAGMVLETWRTTRDRAGRPVELLRSVADARRVARVYDRMPLG